MKIPLSEFKLFVDKSILKRSLACSKKDAIIDFSETSNGEYEALVSGTKEHTVQLKVKTTQ